MKGLIDLPENTRIDARQIECDTHRDIRLEIA